MIVCISTIDSTLVSISKGMMLLHMRKWIHIVLVLLAISILQPGFIQASSKTHVIFTIDVCWMCGSDFQGTYQGTDYGVPFIVDQLNRHHMKGTFFVNPLCPDDLEDTMKNNLQFLVDSGHDVQFHPHPDCIDLTRQNLTDYSYSEKMALYRRGVLELMNNGLPSPIAFRAGCYAIDNETLELLPNVDIHIDSSIFPNDPRTRVSLPLEKANRFTTCNGVFELPITLIRILPFPRYWGTTALDLDRTILCEQKSALDQLASHNVSVVTLFLHFHTFYKYEKSVKDFAPLRVIGVDWENVQEFDALLNVLEQDNRFQVITVRDLWVIYRNNPQALQGPTYIPYTGIWMTYKRSWLHFLGYGIKNKIFALVPIIAMIIPILVLAYRFPRFRINSLVHSWRQSMTRSN